MAIPVAAMQPVSVGSLAQAIVHFGQHGTLAYSLRYFFENGGLQCSVLSLGSGQGEPAVCLQAVLADDRTGLMPELSEFNEVNTFEGADTAKVDVDAVVSEPRNLGYWRR